MVIAVNFFRVFICFWCWFCLLWAICDLSNSFILWDWFHAIKGCMLDHL